jgi:peptidoglycan/xylan/chitin deacetylase (PgdA/CDA1 family)
MYLILFTLGICVIRLGFFVPSFCRGKQPGAGVVLTFDDGPDPSGTRGLLEVLSRHGVKAAFFPTGLRAEAYPDLLREIDLAGHVIGNHTYRHAWFTNLLAGKALEREVVKAQKVVETAIGKTPAFFRPPAGLTNPHLRSVLRRLGLVTVGWDVRVFDSRKKAEKVVEGVVKKVRQGSVILLHEACRDPMNFREMVEAVVTGIRSRGFIFAGLDELTGCRAYQSPPVRAGSSRLSLSEAWRQSSKEGAKNRFRRCTGLWLASTSVGLKALREKTDLSAFKERPSKRFVAGAWLMLFSYVLGWPMVGLFSLLAAYFQRPGLLMGGPLCYGFSHLVFLAGMFLAGRESLRYVEVFSLWSLRTLVERLVGREPGADSA